MGFNLGCREMPVKGVNSSIMGPGIRLEIICLASTEGTGVGGFPKGELVDKCR